MPIKDFFKQYKGVRNTIASYWQWYGGWTTFFTSPYLHCALLLSFFSFPVWLPKRESCVWYEMPIAVLPNLLGFTLGGYAILLAFGNEKFLSAIAGSRNDGKQSPYLTINGSFVHFIVVQVIALIVALLSKSLSIDKGTVAFFGLAIFYYAILTSLMATFAILNVSKWFDRYVEIENDKKNSNSPK